MKRGESVEIPLGIFGSQAEELRFQVRTPPAHGKLSEVAAKGREAAVVRYTPPADFAITGDSFKYAVQNSAGVSAAVDVRIRIIDAPPELSAPVALDFPETLVGKSVRKSVELTNVGGGVAEGEIETDLPWQIQEGARYSIPAGEKHRFTVIFAPSAPGKYSNAIRYSSQRDHSTDLSGTGLGILAAVPESLELKGAKRSAALQLENHSDSDITASLAASGPLFVPSSVVVPAQGAAAADVSAAENATLGDLAGEIRVTGAGADLKIPVRAPAVGPILLASVASVPLERTGEGAAGEFELKNAGGKETLWKAIIDQPYVVAEPASGRLEPGAAARVAIKTTDPAMTSASFRIAGQGGNFAMTAVLSEAVVAQAAPSETRRKSAPAAESRRAISLPSRAGAALVETSLPLAQADAQPDADTASPLDALGVVPGDDPNVFGGMPVAGRGAVRIRSVSPSEATLDWSSSFSNAPRYKAEERILSKTREGGLKIDWVERPIAKLEKPGSDVVVHLQGLKPGASHAFRFLPIGPDGAVGAPDTGAVFITPPQPAFFRVTTTSVSSLLFVLLIVIGFWAVFKRLKAAY